MTSENRDDFPSSAATDDVRFGAVATGHQMTTDAAMDVLREGGNAFDAALAAMCMASVAEPVLSSFGGGGFMVARPVAGQPLAFDFFAQTPKASPSSVGDRDFYAVIADFGAAQQEFHIGLGAMATPGAVDGLFTIHDRLGSLPMARIMEPAIQAARRGYELSAFQGYLFSVVGPIYVATEGARRIFAAKGEPERLIAAGDEFRNPDAADFMEALITDGPDLFYRGEVAARIVDACRAGGGLLSADDLAAYKTEIRDPLTFSWRGNEVLTNPPPSTGGLLAAFALKLLENATEIGGEWGTPGHLTSLAAAMAETNRARREVGVEAIGPSERVAALLDPAVVGAYREAVSRHPQARRGTTHISIVDRAGNAAALTLSNGEGCGYVVPGTGVMMNNMMGEEDINPGGFGDWTPDRRMGSMMTPTVMTGPQGLTVLGSGGSNRIRTAILQTILNLTGFGMDAEAATCAPRIHFERGHLDLEPGFTAAGQKALMEMFADHRLWPEINLFFGGVHIARRMADGQAEAAGDPRRRGAAAAA